MANDKQMSLTAFQTRLKSRYQEKGELDVDRRIDILTTAIVGQTKEGTPFPFNDFLKAIEVEDTELDVLIGSNGAVNIVKLQAVVETAYKISENPIMQEENIENHIQEEIINENYENIEKKLAEIDYTQPLSSDDLMLIAQNWSEWWETTPREKREIVGQEIFKGQVSPDIILLKEIFNMENNSQIVNGLPITDEGRIWFAENRQRLEELNLLNDNGVFENQHIASELAMLAMIEVQARTQINSGKDMSDSAFIASLTQEKKEVAERYRFSLSNVKTAIEQEQVKEQEQGEEGEQSNTTIDGLDFDAYFDVAFENMIDFAEGVKEEREGDDREEAVEPAEPEYNKVEPVLKKSEQIVEPFESNQVENQVQTMAEEESYQAPIIEEEKKGLAKLIDKLRDSKNPVAKFLFNRISSFQNRDAKKLNETNPVIQPDEYTERPSKGRFGVGDSELMPNGTGIRNSFIRVGEGIMKLFQGNKAEKEPIQTRTPINPNHNPNQNEFDARYAVDLKNNAAANGIIVPNNVKSKNDNANNSREGVSSRDEGPSFDD